MPNAIRTDVVALVALGAAAALGIGFMILRGEHAGANPLTAVPADSFMVITVDVASLARSPLGEALVGGKEGTGGRVGALMGLDSATAVCGFDPLPHLRSIAIAIPEGPNARAEADRGDFGVAMSATLGKEQLESCTRALIAKRGGEATTRQQGSFTVISDGRAVAPGEAAFREGGPYLLGKGKWLSRMIDAAEGRVPSTLTAPNDTHALLRADLAARDTDAEALRATALLPQDLRAQVEQQMALEGHESERGVKAMEGILGVSSAGFGIHAGRADEDTRFVAELRCDTATACEAVSTFILHTRLRWSGSLSYRLIGLGPLIDNLEVQPAGASLTVRTHAPTGDLTKVLDRVLGASPTPAIPKPKKPGTPPADEVFPPHGDAGR
jgi:hypothetical protein